MGIWKNLLGTVSSTFKVGLGKATLDASGVTAKTFTLPNQAGTVALDHWTPATGTADALVLTFSPAITSFTDGMIIRGRATADNATTTPTLDVNSLGAYVIKKKGEQALVAGDIKDGHEMLLVMRDDFATQWYELLNPCDSSDAVTKTVTWTAHGRAVKDMIYSTGGGYALADRSDSSKLAQWMISAVPDANSVTLTKIGYVSGLTGLTADTDYALGVGGAIVDASTITTGIRQYIGRALSTTEMDLFIGEAVDLGAGLNAGRTRLVPKLSNEARTSNNTLTNDSELFVDLAVGSYEIDAFVAYTIANATMDFQYDATFSGTHTGWFIREHTFPGLATAANVVENRATTNALPSTGIVGTGSGMGWFRFKAYLNVTVAGTYRIRWAQNTSDAGALTVLAGSNLKVTQHA